MSAVPKTAADGKTRAATRATGHPHNSMSDQNRPAARSCFSARSVGHIAHRSRGVSVPSKRYGSRSSPCLGPFSRYHEELTQRRHPSCADIEAFRVRRLLSHPVRHER